MIHRRTRQVFGTDYRRKKMDRRQFANECKGCRFDGVECRLWNEGICHEQNHYEEDISNGAKNTEQ